MTKPLGRINEGPLEPIFCSVKEAAKALDVTPWSMYQLLDKGVVEGRYFGRSRKVVITSLRAYAEGLPNVPESA